MLARLTVGPQNYRLIRASCSKTSQFLSPGFNWAWTARPGRTASLPVQGLRPCRGGASNFVTSKITQLAYWLAPGQAIICDMGMGLKRMAYRLGHACRVGGRGPVIGIGS